jgi:hypothetical protein
VVAADSDIEVTQVTIDGYGMVYSSFGEDIPWIRIGGVYR